MSNLNPTAIRDAVYRGVELSARLPCSLCRSGKTYDKLPHFHGGDFGRCIRMVAYNKQAPTAFDATPEDRSPFFKLFLNDGHRHELSIVEALRASGYAITGRNEAGDTDEFIREIPVKLGDRVVTVTICGHTDGILEGRVLLECKSVKDWAFENIFRKCKSLAVSKPEYYGQMQCYINALDLAGGLLFVKNRHTSEILLPFVVERNVKFFNARLFALAELQSATDPRYLPERPYIVPEDECRFCDHRSHCWSK